MVLLSNSLSLLALCAASAQAGTKPKRGLIGDVEAATETADSEALAGPNVTTVSWYFSFTLYPNEIFSAAYPFTMQQFGVETTAIDGNNWQNIETLMANVEQTRPQHLMTFLEPAISNISVDQAVAAWRTYITPVQEKFPNMTVGSPNGPASLPWINEFIEKCPDCHFDFVDVHYYWTWQEFKAEVEMWHKRFPKRRLWISDIGFKDYNTPSTECEVGDTECVPAIKRMVTWMDGLDYVHRYTFRGEFRRGAGPGTNPLWSFLTADGGYTDLGKWYLGVKE